MVPSLTVRWPRPEGEASAVVALPARPTLVALVGAVRAALPGLGKVRKGGGNARRRAETKREKKAAATGTTRSSDAARGGEARATTHAHTHTHTHTHTLTGPSRPSPPRLSS